MLFFLFILITYADDSCEKRTKIYDLNGNSNTNYFYFDDRTYTESTKSMTLNDYKDYIRVTLPCVGVWCLNKQFICEKNNSRNCYNVEHIVPKAYDILEIYGCNLDIQGNFIMAYGAWNQQLSNNYYGEKVNIYGSHIFKSAYKSVYKVCYNSDPTNYPEELCLSTNTNLHIGIVLLVISVILLFIVLFLIINYKNDLVKEFYSDVRSLFK